LSVNKQEAFVAFTRAVNSLKARETPKQEQICIKNHKNVKLQDTHNLAKGSRKHVQMMMQIAKRLRVLVPDPTLPYNRDTSKKNLSADLDSWPPARVIILLSADKNRWRPFSNEAYKREASETADIIFTYVEFHRHTGYM